MRIFIFLFFALSLSAQAQSSVSNWYLPSSLSDKNTKVRFEIDSTWHLVKGSTAKISGKAELKEPSDPTSVHVHLSFLVAEFDTDNSMRDDKLREVMSADTYPTLTFESISLQNQCTPAVVLRDGNCSDFLQGQLTILSTTQPVDLPIVISADKNRAFTIKGEIPLKWKEFGVEDPSILIARVKPTVTIFFEVLLAENPSN